MPKRRGLRKFGPDRKIGIMQQQGLCHPKCSKWEQDKQSDLSDFIGCWSKQAIWFVQLLSLWRGCERYFLLWVTKVPFLKSCLWLISFISGSDFGVCWPAAEDRLSARSRDRRLGERKESDGRAADRKCGNGGEDRTSFSWSFYAGASEAVKV